MLAPPSATTENSTHGRELHIQSKARYHKQMRDELFTKDGEEGKLLPASNFLIPSRDDKITKLNDMKIYVVFGKNYIFFFEA